MNNEIKNITVIVEEASRRASDNPLTVLANVLRNRSIQPSEKAIFDSHNYTDEEVRNVRFSLGMAA